MRTKKYSFDLAGQMAECEANYARIMQLLPDMTEVDRREFAVDLPGAQPGRLQIVIRERCKYTTMVDVSQLSPHSSAPFGEALQPPCFSLRVYHDARMAEVVTFNHHQQLRPKYDYPNNKMYQRDEKAQLNIFLGEWLSHCLQYGYALESPAKLPL